MRKRSAPVSYKEVDTTKSNTTEDDEEPPAAAPLPNPQLPSASGGAEVAEVRAATTNLRLRACFVEQGSSTSR